MGPLRWQRWTTPSMTSCRRWDRVTNQPRHCASFHGVFPPTPVLVLTDGVVAPLALVRVGVGGLLQGGLDGDAHIVDGEHVTRPWRRLGSALVVRAADVRWLHGHGAESRQAVVGARGPAHSGALSPAARRQGVGALVLAVGQVEWAHLPARESQLRTGVEGKRAIKQVRERKKAGKAGKAASH